MSEQPVIKIEIDHQKCEGCAVCVSECPVEMYAIKNDKAIVVKDPQEDCELCRLCESKCPNEAIIVIEEYP